MQIGTWLLDKKIRGLNVSLDLNIEEYWKVAENILTKNEFQRRKVQAKGNAYALLRRDLIQGCIMPPIILAVTEQFGERVTSLVQTILKKGVIDDHERVKLDTFIEDAFKEKELIILDGLQRSFTIKSALEETYGYDREKLRNHVIRVEIYLGLSKMGILYRMLTLNTGQTPMSFRHQLEMLYHDYLQKDNLLDGITVLREIEESRARGIGKYKYSDVIDLFYSFSTGTAKSIDKETLVSQLRELDFLENFKADSEDMMVLLQVYNKFATRVNTLSEGWEYPIGMPEGKDVPRPFGVNVPSIFGKVQAMTGFGSACARLIKTERYTNLSGIVEAIDLLTFGSAEPADGLVQLVIVLDEIAKSANRVGDAQRAYFELAFRELFNPDSDSYLNLSNCWVFAQEKYEVMY